VRCSHRARRPDAGICPSLSGRSAGIATGRLRMRRPALRRSSARGGLAGQRQHGGQGLRPSLERCGVSGDPARGGDVRAGDGVEEVPELERERQSPRWQTGTAPDRRSPGYIARRRSGTSRLRSDRKGGSPIRHSSAPGTRGVRSAPQARDATAQRRRVSVAGVRGPSAAVLSVFCVSPVTVIEGLSCRT